MLFAVALFTFGLSMNSCGSKSSSTEAATEEVDMSGPEYTSAYVCPMHCAGSGSAEPGKCPVCGMDYVANDGKMDSSDSHEGHDH